MQVGDLVKYRLEPHCMGIVTKMWDESKHRARETLYSVIWFSKTERKISEPYLNKKGDLNLVSSRRPSKI